VAAVRAKHQRVAKFMHQYRYEDHGDPNQNIFRISVLAAQTEKYGCDPKERVNSNRDAEKPKVKVGLRRWWFAEKHQGKRLRILDCGLPFSIHNR
jgi:hypothetical protein